ncbi:MAG: adenylosuccinate lyase [Gemmatimonadota bacterium]|nr:MAG: adenylosuccinate lyase [Gemmatimonadota bacterium]
MSADSYQNPLITRYASVEMATIFGPRYRARIWRQLWIALAEAERELGLDVSEEAIAAMRAGLDNIDLDRIAEFEAETRHEVMAHIHHFGEVAPAAKGVIHLGATSAFVMDNADLVQHREALKLIRRRILGVVAALRDQALKHRGVNCVGYTHLQPAQPTTVGKRITLWLQDLLLDLESVEFRLDKLRFRGARGATGTEASFLLLFDGDSEKVDRLNTLVAEKLGFRELFGVSSQTYPRKLDATLLATLSEIAQSASKFANDVRLLQSFGEIQEPFKSSQVGSSAMPHKRNPMRCERMNALARHVMVLALDPAISAAAQWLERTLDDSANKRIAVPEAYLATDSVLLLWHNVAAGMNVYPEVAARRLAEQLPYLAAEPVLLVAARRGGDRQTLHEVIRKHAMAAAEEVRQGKPNDLAERLAADPAIGIGRDELERMLTPEAMAGRAPQQVDNFIAERVDPLLERYKDEIEHHSPTLTV